MSIWSKLKLLNSTGSPMFSRPAIIHSFTKTFAYDSSRGLLTGPPDSIKVSDGMLGNYRIKEVNPFQTAGPITAKARSAWWPCGRTARQHPSQRNEVGGYLELSAQAGTVIVTKPGKTQIRTGINSYQESSHEQSRTINTGLNCL